MMMNGDPRAQAGGARERYPFRQKRLLLRQMLTAAYLKPAARNTLLVSCVLTAALNVAIPPLIGQLVEMIVHLPQTGAIGLEGIARGITLLIGLYLFTSALGYGQGLLGASLSQKQAYRLREAIYGKLLRLPVVDTDTHAHGDLMSRTLNDVETASQLVIQVLCGLVLSSLTAVCSIVFIAALNHKIALFTLASAAVSMLLSLAISGKVFRAVGAQQQALGRLNHTVASSVSGYRSVLAFQKQQEFLTQGDRFSDGLEQASIRAQFCGGMLDPLLMVVGNLSFIALIVLGSLDVLDASLTIGAMQTCILFARQFLKSVNDFGAQWIQLQTGFACADRVFQMERRAAETDEGTQDDPALFAQDLHFEHVRFGYTREKDVLTDVSFTLPQGKTYALVGATGEGKTTLMNLLLRFFEPDAGTIRFGNTDLRLIRKTELRRQVSIVLQDPVLFSDTVLNNIGYGQPGYPYAEAARCAGQAGATAVIDALPHGLQTQLLRGGCELSEGQRQLLCFTRVWARQPALLVLDEATSDMDTLTEAALGQSLQAFMKGRSCLVIAHRLSTVRNADRILVLANGCIAEQGTHEELLAVRGIYYRLYRNQWL